MNEQEFITYVTRSLDRGAHELDEPIAAGLSAARHHALAAPATPVVQGRDATLAWAHGRVWLATLTALTLVVAGWTYMRSLETVGSVQTDIMLLTDPMPPNIYADRIFALWLKGYRN